MKLSSYSPVEAARRQESIAMRAPAITELAWDYLVLDCSLMDRGGGEGHGGEADFSVSLILHAMRDSGTAGRIAKEALERVEARRGHSYSVGHGSKLLRRFRDSALSIVESRLLAAASEACSNLIPPQRPGKVWDAYWAAHDEWKHRVDVAWVRKKRDAGEPPTKPRALQEFENECVEFVKSFRDLVRPSCLDWEDEEFRSSVAATIAADFHPKAQPPTQVRRRSEGRPLARTTGLAGEPSFDGERVREELRIYARKVHKIDMVFGEEVWMGETNVAIRARHSESRSHRNACLTLVSLFRRLGYRVYAGDAGVSNVFAMADLVAWDRERLYFVEYLSKKSIKAGHHMAKLDLARRVPFCFVGVLPEDFLRSLPPNAFAISQPKATRMLGGEHVPYFWRRDPSRSMTLEVGRQKARTVTRLDLAMRNLRLPEDVAGFLWTAVFAQLRTHRTKGRQFFEYRIPRVPIGQVPFEGMGKPNSTFRIATNESSLSVKFGTLPLRAELRGTDQTLDHFLDLVRAGGLSVDLMDAD